MKTLVTGATGFLGTALVSRLCERGDEVFCVAKDRINLSDLEKLKVKTILSDLNDEGSFSHVLGDIDVVFHLAGATRARTSREYYDSNVRATKHFIDVCARKATLLTRFVHVSSIAAVGPSTLQAPLTEESPFKPISEYGRTKMLGEQEAMRAKDRLPITIIRPSSVYGPRERDMYDMFRAVGRGIYPVLGFTKKRVSALHSDDFIEGMIKASEAPRALGETYFLGSEHSYTAEDIGAAIAKAMNKRPWQVRVPHSILYAIGAASQIGGKVTGKQVFMNVQKVRELVQPAWTCSVAKAQDHFGFRQTTSLEDGMAKTYQWYAENGWL